MQVYTGSQNEQQFEAIPEDHSLGSTNPDSQLDPAAKRLMLGAHLGQIFKRLRRGLSIEEQEIRALLPFTVCDGWRPELGNEPEPDEGDQRWLQLVESARAIG